MPAHQRIYDRLFAEYRQLHDYFGRGGSDVMKRLKTIRNQVLLEAKTNP
jgi:L-ribulokinase